MGKTRRGVALTPMETRRDVILRAAELADQLGYEAFSVPEAWGFDSTVLLTEIALRTRQIKLVAGILSVWGRTPATLAMSAASLHQVSGGRFVLGLGPSTKALVEGFHGQPYLHAADRLRDVTTKVRALLAGERAHIDLPEARPLRLGLPAVPDLPIWIAALGSRSVSVAAELADCWFPAYVTRDRFARWLPDLNRQRATAGTRPGPLPVAAGPNAVADEDPAAARNIAAATTAWYLCAMGDVYARSVSEQGYGAEVQAVIAANSHPSPQGSVIPPEAQKVLDQLAVYGSVNDVRSQLELWNGVVDIVMIGLPPSLPWQSLETTLRAAAP